MKPWRTVGRALASGTVTVLLIVLAPAVLLFGELVNRHYLGGLPPGRDRILVRRRGLPGRRVVARSAGPGRAAHAAATPNHKVARRGPGTGAGAGGGGGGGGGGKGRRGAGVREPRRPLPDRPAAAMALPEPGPFD